MTRTVARPFFVQVALTNSEPLFDPLQRHFLSESLEQPQLFVRTGFVPNEKVFTSLVLTQGEKGCARWTFRQRTENLLDRISLEASRGLSVLSHRVTAFSFFVEKEEPRVNHAFDLKQNTELNAVNAAGWETTN